MEVAPPASPDHLRLFLAIEIPDEVKRRVLKVGDDLRGLLRKSVVRWTRPEQLHLTLKFLGNVKPDDVDPLSRAVSEVCRGFSPLRLHAGSLGCFPRWRSPRVLWVGIRDEGNQLGSLQAALESASAPFTLEPAEREFTGHVTLGRVKACPRAEIEALSRLAEQLRSLDCGQWTASAVSLIRSQLDPAGARYTELAAARLAGDA
jgi:2'-5' RNA ligase